MKQQKDRTPLTTPTISICVSHTQASSLPAGGGRGELNPLFVILTIPESLQVKHEPLKT